MENLVIDIGETNLVVEKYESPEGHEFVMYFQDKKTNCITQDIVTVRPAIGDDGQPIAGAVECMVWTDDSDENYTHKFCINQLLEVA